MSNEVDNFLNGLENEPKADPFKPDVEDPFAKTAEVGTEEKQADIEEDKPVPFHKDPKVQRYIQKEIEKATKNIAPTVTEQFVKDTGSTEDEISDVLTRIIGNDTPEKAAAVKDFRKALVGLEEKAAQKARAEMQAEVERERLEEAQAQEELATAFDSIEEEFNVDLTSNSPVARKTRGEFVDFIQRVSPKDEYGQVTQFPDLRETYQLFQETKSSKRVDTNSRAKELASRSIQRSNDASTTPKLGGNSWSDVDKVFSKLLG